MRAYQFTLFCPNGCGGDSLTHLHSVAHGALSVAIVRCTACACEYEVSARIAPLETPKQRAARERQRRHRERVRV